MPSSDRPLAHRPARQPRPFLGEDFLLSTQRAEELYHRYAAPMPIVDYHCHLPPEQISQDRRFENLTAIWLAGDHYKWRAMRANGVAERYCTGDAPDRDKFQQWAETVPKCLRNPLYHWTHLELRRPFGISDRLLDGGTAQGIWEQGNALLAQEGFSARGIMRQMGVAVVCTTDDPTDALEHHRQLAREGFEIQVRPTWRPDRGMAIDDPRAFAAWLGRLEAASGVTITTFGHYLQALSRRHDYFHEHGCRLSDHGLDTVYAESFTTAEVTRIFAKVRSGQSPDAVESACFKSAMLYEWAVMDHRRGWVQQFHIGAMRNNNARIFRALGPDQGVDSIDDQNYARPLSRFLDRLDSSDQLAKTIVYNLNPRDNDLIATLLGNFQDGSVPGKIQFGSAWWFLDQKDGMERQLDSLSNMGLLSRFVGMLTDSRSFLSYTRHEYFRRILCAKLGAEMEEGMLPDDLGLIGAMVSDICYGNAARYFDFGLAQVPASRQGAAKS
jgi:glucuronate isomerase